jgi:predicted RNA-binding Zn-ribbon protein involved in translation (DUF1610 family)
MKRKNPVEFKCNKCGKAQPRNDEKSNKNWSVFDCKQVCECGGKFVVWINGKPLSGGEQDE